MLFTNNEKLLDAEINQENQSQMGLNSLSRNCPLGFDYSTNKFTTLEHNHNIIAIHDNIDTNDINNCLKNIITKADRILMLVHSDKPKNEVQLFIKNINAKTEVTKSLHEPGMKYTQIFNAILKLHNGEEEKSSVNHENIVENLQNILGIDDILEAKLNLLHQCLTPQGAKDVSTLENFNLVKDLELETVDNNNKIITVEKYISQKFNGDDPFHPDYIKALTDLRDELLKEY